MHSGVDEVSYALPPLWRVLTTFCYFLALSGAIGMTVTYVAAVAPALRRVASATDAEAMRRRASSWLAGSGALLLGAAYFQLVSRVARANEGMAYADAFSPAAIGAFLTQPAPEGAWVSRGSIILIQNVVIVIVALLLLSLSTGAVRRRLDLVAAIAAPLAVVMSLVASVPGAPFKTLDEAVNKVLVQAHIVGGSVWVGGLVLLAVLAVGTRRRLSASGGILWSVVWRNFGLVALVCVGAVVVSGLWLTWQEVGAIEQLWTTTFGLILLVKIVLVLGMILAGALNQFWLMPRIARARAADATSSLRALTLTHFPRVVWGEIVLAVGVLAIVPLLAGSARAEAGDQAAPPLDAGLLLLGLLLVATLAASFVATVKASDLLGRRLAAAGS